MSRKIGVAGKCLETLVIFFWMMSLRSTDSYFSVYILVAAIATLALWARKKWVSTYSRGDLMYAGIFAIIISLAIFLANYQCYIALPGYARLFRELVILVGGFIAAGNIMLFFLTPTQRNVSEQRKNHLLAVFLGCFAALFAVYLTYLLCAAYPCYLTLDSHNSLNQIETGIYINNHPFWFTMLLRLLQAVGRLFTEDSFYCLGAYSIAQITAAALTFAYAIVTLYETGLQKRWLIAMLVLYGISPYNLAYAVVVEKDVWFGIAILLWMISLYRIIGMVGDNRLNYILLCAGCVGTCLMRTNGWFVAFLSFLIFLVGFRGHNIRKANLIMGFSIAFCWILTGPVLTMLDVGETNFVEGLSLPLQQIARVLFNEYQLPDADMEMLEKIFNLEKIPEEFSHGSADPVKTVIFKVDQKDFLKEHALEYIALWLRIGASHPVEYLKAWIELTKGYWNGGYAYEIYYLGEGMPSVGLMSPQIFRDGKALFQTFFDFLEGEIWYQPFISIGLQVWTLIACFLLNARWKRWERMLTVPFLIIVFGLWIGTPVYAEFRYAYPIFLSVPFLMAVTAHPVGTGITEHSAVQKLTRSQTCSTGIEK